MFGIFHGGGLVGGGGCLAVDSIGQIPRSIKGNHSSQLQSLPIKARIKNRKEGPGFTGFSGSIRLLLCTATLSARL